MKTTIALYGIGNFGYAWLKHFDYMQRDDIELIAYDRNPAVIEKLTKEARHPFLHTGVELSQQIHFATSPEDLVKNADLVLLAVTSEATRDVIGQIKDHLKKNVILVNTAKALDGKTGKRLSQIVAEEMDDRSYHYALLAGGTIASDLFAHEPLGMDSACENEEAQKEIIRLCSSKNLRIYPSSDLIGVEYASAYKNVIAILAGMIAGMGFSYGSETHIISRAATEIAEMIITTYGAQKETFSMASQCWGNDLWMSCTGKTRNRAFGELLGKGMEVDDAIAQMKKEHKTVEGIRTIAALGTIENYMQYPLIAFLYQYIETKTATPEDMKKIIFDHTF